MLIRLTLLRNHAGRGNEYRSVVVERSVAPDVGTTFLFKPEWVTAHFQDPLFNWELWNVANIFAVVDDAEFEVVLVPEVRDSFKYAVPRSNYFGPLSAPKTAFTNRIDHRI